MLLSMDAHSIQRDTGITGDRDKRSEWVERDETMDHRSTSHNTIASASRRIVCLALISGPDLSNSFSPTFVLSPSSSFLRDHLFRVCSIVDTRRLEGSPIFPFLSLSLSRFLFTSSSSATLLLLLLFSKSHPGLVARPSTRQRFFFLFLSLSFIATIRATSEQIAIAEQRCRGNSQERSAARWKGRSG